MKSVLALILAQFCYGTVFGAQLNSSVSTHFLAYRYNYHPGEDLHYIVAIQSDRMAIFDCVGKNVSEGKFEDLVKLCEPITQKGFAVNHVWTNSDGTQSKVSSFVYLMKRIVYSTTDMLEGVGYTFEINNFVSNPKTLYVRHSGARVFNEGFSQGFAVGITSHDLKRDKVLAWPLLDDQFRFIEVEKMPPSPQPR